MKVFSFCLYNAFNALYYDGLLENMAMIRAYYPDWTTFVYIGNDVPDEFVWRLGCAGAQIRFTRDTGHINMIYRFLAIEEPGVEIMMVRDADSRIHWKDRWAIDAFVASPYLAHSIRDCLVHCIPMLGGTWGLKREAAIPIGLCFENYKTSQQTMEGLARAIGKDQTFLNMYIWPRVRHSLLVHTSISFRSEGDIIVSFPFQWSNDIYCGRVEGPGYREPRMPPPVRKSVVHSLPSVNLKFSLT
jgi:protein O-GlcNAc transferase